MPDWSPPIDTGLSGELYLSEHIETFVDALADAHEPGVYAVVCSTPDTTSVERYAREWLDYYEVTPPFLADLAGASTLIYVGAAQDVYDRLREHLDAPNRTGSVCRPFPIHHVEELWFTETPFERESQIGMQLQHDRPDAYVHFR